MDRFWVYAGLVGLVGLGYAAIRGAAGPRVTRDSRVLLIGDSLSVGLNPTLRSLAAEAGVAYGYCGAQGRRIDEFTGGGTYAQCLRRQLAELRPTLVLILLGTNDEAMAPQYAPRQLAEAEKLIGTVKAAGADYLWISPAKSFEASKVISGLRKLVPASRWFDSTRIGVPLVDGIGHSSPRGYALWSGAIWRDLCRQC